jgi:hypothetical protein
MVSNEQQPNGDVAPSKRHRRRRALFRRLTLTRFLLCILMCVAGAQAIRSVSASVGIDYYQFWAVGRDLVQRGNRSVYGEASSARLGRRLAKEAARGDDAALRQAGAWRGSLSATGTPLHYALVGQLSSPSYGSSLKTYRLTLVTCFCGSVLCFAWVFGLSLSSSLAALCLLLVGFEPLTADLRVGNVNCLQLAGLGLYAWLRLRSRLRQRAVVAALWLGLLVAFKPNLLALTAILSLQPLLRRSFRTFFRDLAASSAGVGLAVLLACFNWRSAHVWLDWLNASTVELAGWATVDQGNYAPLALLRAYSPTFGPVWLASALLGIAALGAWLQDPERAAEAPSATASEIPWYLAIGCLAPVILTHLAWAHYFVLTLPALLFVTSRWNGIAFRPPGNAGYSARRIARLGLVIAAWLLLLGSPSKVLDWADPARALVHVAGVLVLLCSLCAERPR